MSPNGSFANNAAAGEGHPNFFKTGETRGKKKNGGAEFENSGIFER